ncbi:hypothetical protein K443DRAFT_682025 [Laccaria amethystina LaAM-08-1]|uniref:Uncharacterized protein n=1 Tax=Laccaria amethystina LaAM-08-1 TaxID=1095629 RepID=A0A0C9XKT7_9AGAR|nr:hypothetical protein K443DRAFT_682025 [Laccaria amethystina LaAM-08-1]
MSAQLPNASFAFLATPPALKKRAQPLPSPPLAPLPARPTTRVHRRRSSTFNNISNWAATVQPGSPPPCSPKRRPSVTSTRRPSITRLTRRPSIGHGRAPSGSFINLIDTPSPASTKAFDLTQLGYASVFVHLPKTPTTPSPYLRPRLPPPVPAQKPADVPLTAAENSYAHIPIPPIPAAKPKPTMKRFRSLSLLRPRSKSNSAPSSPTKSIKSTTSTAKATKAQICASSTTITKRKKAAYAVRPPPPLANELAIMQFSEGGSTETNIRRMMEAQAKATGATGVADVYRDGKGGFWWDQDEELEYAPLLGGAGADVEDADEEMQWVSFADASGSDKENSPDVLAIAGLADVDRRGSVSSQDSDLNPAYMMHTEQVEEVTNDVRKFGGGSVPGLSVLSLPSRPRRAAKHLRKPEFMIDMAAFGPRSPVKGRFSAGAASPTRGAMVKPKGKARRRPAPLKLAPVYTQHKRPTNSPVGANARKEFMDDSFAPAPLPVAPLVPVMNGNAGPATPLLQTRNMAAMKSVDSLALRSAKKPGKLMKSLFGGRSKGD